MTDKGASNNKADWRTPDQDDLFFAKIRRTGNVSKALKAAKYKRTATYAMREKDEAFAIEWNAAVDEYVDGLEEEMDRRGFEGIEEPVIYQGQRQYRRDKEGKVIVDGKGKPVVETRLVKDTTAAIFRLKGLRPEKYREHFQLAGKGGGPVEIKVVA